MEYFASQTSVNETAAYYVCAGSAVMYVSDPSGYGIQLDTNGAYSLSTCSAEDFNWFVDEFHYSCENGNCTPLANLSARVVQNSGQSWVPSDDPDRASDATTDKTPKRAEGHWKTIAVYVMLASFMAATVVVWARRRRVARQRGYRGIPESEWGEDWDKPKKAAA